MCGIAGIWSMQGDNADIRQELLEAVSRLRHRGPDDRGTWTNDAGVGLGHTRLSIIDLTQFGHQPMVSADGRHVIVFNGEIYNHAELRKQLQAAGHTFAGTGDTEVILHAFREWGTAAVRRFIGMFAIAFWDQQEQKLELIRDRIGVKPLYYGWDGKTLCFGSELKALRAFRHWTPRINPQAVGEFLQYGFISESRSIYEDVFKLQPGHRLVLRRGHEPVLEPYWSVLDHAREPLSGSDQDIEAQLEALLIDAFRYRMVSDVPVGVFLSGGVDSSLVTAILAKHYDRPIQTFTIGFAEDSHDESAWAARVAAHCGTQHATRTLHARDAAQLVGTWGTLFDEPFGDFTGSPALLLARVASENVKVVLSADGGDELFSGYNSYTAVLDRLRTLGHVPSWVARATSSSLAALYPSRLDALMKRLHVPTPWRKSADRKAYRLKHQLDDPTPGGLMDLAMSYWRPDDISTLLGRYTPPRKSANSYPGDAANQISLLDFHHYLPEDILTKVDRTTMAASIEGREPLIDHRIAEFAFRLPQHLRRGPLGPKHLLKRILYRYVPRSLVDRPKQGFSVPLESWLRDDLKALVSDYLAEDRIRRAGIMDWRLVSQVRKEFAEGDSHLALPVWFLVAFEMWREQWG